MPAGIVRAVDIVSASSYKRRMKLRCIVVDDEPPARDELAWLLSNTPGVEVVATAASADAAVRAVREHTPDAVFLDIRMPGRSGFDALREIAELPSPPLAVFVTAYDEFAIRAFEENAMDYVLKPASEERIAKTVERLRARLADGAAGTDGAAAESSDIERILAAIDSARSRPAERISVEAGGRVMLLSPEEVLFFRSADKRLMAHDRDGCYPVHGNLTLDKLEKRLADRPFLRVHRTFLVNLDHVRAYSPWENGRYLLVMDDSEGTELTVSRAQAREFKRRIGLLDD